MYNGLEVILTTVQVMKWSCFMDLSRESYNNEATVASTYKVPTKLLNQT